MTPGDRATGLLNPLAIRDFSIWLADAVGRVLDAGRFPVVLGGDCTVLIGTCWRWAGEGATAYFFLDGHADFYQAEASPTGAVSNMDLALGSGRGPDVLSDIEGRRPFVRDEDVMVFGYRDDPGSF